MNDKPLLWVGSSLEDIRAFPEDARQTAGFQLRRLQQGLMPADWKSVPTIGQGVYEIRIRTALEHRVRETHSTDPRVGLELARSRLSEVLRLRKRE